VHKQWITSPRRRQREGCTEAIRNAHPRCANAAVINPVHGGEGNRSKPKYLLRIPEPRQTIWHGLADRYNGKKRVARTQRQRRFEVANMANGRNAANARGQRSAEKPQQPDRSESAATLNHAMGSLWRRDVDEDMAALTAAVDTPGPHSLALPPRTVAEGLSRPDADKWQAAIDEELASRRKFGVWEEVHLLEEKQALPSLFIFEIEGDDGTKRAWLPVDTDSGRVWI
jgi:hypothetical protein